ncbi:MAG: hypothetical protein JXX28_08325 [Deltaproteobacteria bacterium]|nr:hypothetical protein [Deltaproteobacteria bacterium]
MKSPRTYTPTEKRHAIELTLEVGLAQASQETGFPRGTLSSWAHKAHNGIEGYAHDTLLKPTDDTDPSDHPDAVEAAAASDDTEAPSSADLPTPQPADTPVKTGNTARVYTPSEKARALERVAALGVTAASRELGISRFSL